MRMSFLINRYIKSVMKLLSNARTKTVPLCFEGVADPKWNESIKIAGGTTTLNKGESSRNYWLYP
ncbi:hypothetical protein BIW11_08735, partial [Tropilaelaps mercedesae]